MTVPMGLRKLSRQPNRIYPAMFRLFLLINVITVELNDHLHSNS